MTKSLSVIWITTVKMCQNQKLFFCSERRGRGKIIFDIYIALISFFSSQGTMS